MTHKKFFYGWYIVGACFFFCLIFAGAGFYSFSLFIKPIESEFGWSRSAISLTMSIYLLTAGLFSPLAGHLIQKFGPKKIMLTGAVAAGACFMAVSFTQALWYFYLAYALLAVSVSGIGVIPVSSLLSNWFEKKRGTAIGIAMVGIAFGGMILAPMISKANSLWGWKSAFLGIGCMVWLVALPLIIFVVKDFPAQLGLAPDGKAGNPSSEPVYLSEHEAMALQDGWEAGVVLKGRPFWCIFISFFLAPLAQMGVLQHQVPIVMGVGIPETVAAAALGATAGIGGVGKLSFGWLSENLRFRYIIMLCFGLQAGAVLLLIHLSSPVMLWIYAVLFGFSMGGIVVLMPLVVGKYWGLRSYGVLLGVIWVANATGGAVGTYTSGLAYDFLGNYNAVLYMFIGAYLAAIATFIAAGNPRKAPA